MALLDTPALCKRAQLSSSQLTLATLRLLVIPLTRMHPEPITLM